MATAYHNLSDYDFNSVPNAEEMKFGIVVSEWNDKITGALLDGANKYIKKTWRQIRKHFGKDSTRKL